MEVAILTTGDELMAGDIADTNAQWMSQHCWQRGASVVWRVSVGDDKEAIGQACQDAAKKGDVVLVTGGLGPTSDDVTLAAAAKAFGTKLIHHKIGADLPEGARPLANIVGTAPGCEVELGGATFFFFPGVPKELYPMFENFFLPWIEARLKHKIVYQERILKCFGSPEATIDAKLRDISLGPVALSFRVRFPEVWLKVRIRGGEAEAIEKEIGKVVRQIRERLGSDCFGEGADTLASVLGKLLVERGETVAVAESCTGGAISDTITNVAGASQFFEQTVVSYSNEAKRDRLGVGEETIRTHGAVSEAAVREMAEGIRKVSKATYGLGVSGIAGPSGGTAEKPVGTVFIAIAGATEIKAKHFCFPRDRLEFKQVVCATALDWLRRELL